MLPSTFAKHLRVTAVYHIESLVALKAWRTILIFRI